MPTMKDIVSIKDSITFTLNQTDLTSRKIGEFMETTKRHPPRSDGLQWWVRRYPVGTDEYAKDHIGVFLFVNNPVKAKFTFAVDGSLLSRTTTIEFTSYSKGRGWPEYTSHEALRPLFRDGKLAITCCVEFDVEVPVTSFVPRNFQLFDHIPTDVELVVGSERMPFHKNFISMISPVFHAMFSHNTAESISGQVEITDFDCDTVKAAVDLCYGRDLKNPSVDTIVSILRFADKYFISAVTNEFERLLMLNLSIETFGLIVHYADDCSKKTLWAECCKFYKDHQNDIKDLPTFAKLPPALMVDLLKSTFNLKTDFNVLRHAHKNSIASVVEHLELPFLKQMTLQNFCPAVEYAWDCSRDELKTMCAKLFNRNTTKIIDLKNFHELPAETIRQLIEASYTLTHGTD